jgi:hypothetical protein
MSQDKANTEQSLKNEVRTLSGQLKAQQNQLADNPLGNTTRESEGGIAAVQGNAFIKAWEKDANSDNS